MQQWDQEAFTWTHFVLTNKHVIIFVEIRHIFKPQFLSLKSGDSNTLLIEGLADINKKIYVHSQTRCLAYCWHKFHVSFSLIFFFFFLLTLTSNPINFFKLFFSRFDKTPMRKMGNHSMQSSFFWVWQMTLYSRL